MRAMESPANARGDAPDVLRRTLARKQAEVAERRARLPLEALRERASAMTAGAACLSVLTDAAFQGSDEDLVAAPAAT